MLELQSMDNANGIKQRLWPARESALLPVCSNHLEHDARWSGKRSADFREVGLHQLVVLALRNLLRALGGAPAEITRGRLPENFVRGGVSGVDLPNLTTSKLYAVFTVVV